MESLTELENCLSSIDMTKEDEDRIARIIEKLRDEIAAS